MSALKRLLVVDDDPEYRGMLAEALGPAFEVRAASDGEEALAACRAEPPDAVVLDLFLPRVGGLEVLRGLEAGEETRGIPVLVLSAALLDAGLRAALAERPSVRGVLDKLNPLRRLREAVAAIC